MTRLNRHWESIPQMFHTLMVAHAPHTNAATGMMKMGTGTLPREKSNLGGWIVPRRILMITAAKMTPTSKQKEAPYPQKAPTQ